MFAASKKVTADSSKILSPIYQPTRRHTLTLHPLTNYVTQGQVSLIRRPGFTAHTQTCLTAAQNRHKHQFYGSLRSYDTLLQAIDELKHSITAGVKVHLVTDLHTILTSNEHCNVIWKRQTKF